MSHSTTPALCYFNCCYFEEWRFSKFCQGCPRRMDELWIIYHLCGNTLGVWYGGGGLHSAVHLHSCYGGPLIGDWWRGIFHRASTSSSTPSLGLPLSPVHGVLDGYDWQRWSPHAVTNYSSQWLPSWWINVYCVSRTAAPPPAPLSHEMRDECVLIWSSAPCTTLIIIFIDEYHCRQDDEVAICVRRLSQANTEQGLCHQREIWSCTDLRPMCLFQLAFLAHAHTISLSPDSLLWIYKIYVPIHATF